MDDVLVSVARVFDFDDFAGFGSHYGAGNGLVDVGKYDFAVRGVWDAACEDAPCFVKLGVFGDRDGQLLSGGEGEGDRLFAVEAA